MVASLRCPTKYIIYPILQNISILQKNIYILIPLRRVMTGDNEMKNNDELWLYLSPTVARQFTPEKHIIIDPTDKNGIRSNSDMFPINVPAFEPVYITGQKAYTLEGISVKPVASYAYTHHVKQASVVGGRGASAAETAYGEILKSIAESDFPFIELTHVQNGGHSYACFKHPIQLPEGIELEFWEKGTDGLQELKNVIYRYSYRNGFNEDRIGYIIDKHPNNL